MLKVFQTLLARPFATNYSPANGGLSSRFSDAVSKAIVLSFLLLAFGCGEVNRAKIVGRWEISVGERVLDRVDNSSQAVPPASNDGLKSDNEPPRLVVEFFNSGVLQTETRISDAISKKKGTWTLLEFDEGNQQIKIQCELIGQVTEHEVTLVSENEIKMVPPNMAGLKKKLNFKRN